MTRQGQPPRPRYRLTLEIGANTLAELEQALDERALAFAVSNGGRETRDEVGPRHHLRLEHVDPTMTPERYTEELRAWWSRRSRPVRVDLA